MKSWIYERRLTENVEHRLQRYKNRSDNRSLERRQSWYELGFFDGWKAAIQELKPQKTR